MNSTGINDLSAVQKWMVDSIEVVSRISGKWEAEVRRRVLYATSFLLLYTYVLCIYVDEKYITGLSC